MINLTFYNIGKYLTKSLIFNTIIDFIFKTVFFIKAQIEYKPLQHGFLLWLHILLTKLFFSRFRHFGGGQSCGYLISLSGSLQKMKTRSIKKIGVQENFDTLNDFWFDCYSKHTYLMVLQDDHMLQVSHFLCRWIRFIVSSNSRCLDYQIITNTQ